MFKSIFFCLSVGAAHSKYGGSRKKALDPPGTGIVKSCDCYAGDGTQTQVF